MAALSVLRRDHLLHVAVDRRIDHVLGADHVGLDHFEGVVFGRRHLLQRRGVDHDVDAVASPDRSRVAIAHVADEIAHARIFLLAKDLPHVGLFQFVPAKNNQLAGRIVAQDRLDELFAERPGPSGNEHDLICEQRRLEFHDFDLTRRGFDCAISHRPEYPRQGFDAEIES